MEKQPLVTLFRKQVPSYAQVVPTIYDEQKQIAIRDFKNVDKATFLASTSVTTISDVPDETDS